MMSERSNPFAELQQALQAALMDLAHRLGDCQVEVKAVYGRIDKLRRTQEDAKPSFKRKDEILKTIERLSKAQENIKPVLKRIEELRSRLQAGANEIGLDLSSSGEAEED